MLAIRPTTNKTYKKVELKTNHYNIKLSSNGATHAYRYDITLKSAPAGQDAQALIDRSLAVLQPKLLKTFGWYHSSGKTFYTLQKSTKIPGQEGDLETPLFNKEFMFEVPNLILAENMSTDDEEESDKLALYLTPAGDILDLKELTTCPLSERSEYLQILEAYKSSVMSFMGLKEFGKSGKFFDTRQPIGSVFNQLNILGGFKVSFGVYQGQAAKLLFDRQCRIVHKYSLWDTWCNGVDNRVPQRRIESNILGNFFVDRLTDKLVRVHGIDHKLGVMSTHPDPKYPTYRDYFEQVFGAEVEDLDQFLVFSQKTKKLGIYDSEGKEKVLRERTYYLPECLVATGLTQRMKNDFKMMQEVAKYTRISPQRRDNLQRQIVGGFKEAMEEGGFPEVFELEEEASKVKALLMPKPKIKFKKDVIQATKGNFFVKGHAQESVNIDRWALIYEGKDEFAQDFEGALYESCTKLGFGLDYSEMIQLPNRKRTPADIKNAINKAMKGGVSMIVFIINKFTAKKGYKLIKEICCKKLGIASQVILYNPKLFTKRGVFDKIAIQMATKLGVSPWLVQKPLERPRVRTMMIGADVYHSAGRESIASVVGTLNGTFSKYHSLSSRQPKKGQEIMENVADMVLECIQAYENKNKAIPELVVFYRDGVGSGQHELVETFEIKRILDLLDKQYGEDRPKLVFALVTKRINDRFYQPSAGRKGPKGLKKGALGNPESGMIIDSGVVSDNKFDYFMVAQNVTQGTATPTRYEFLLNESECPADFFYTMTYFQTFNYYNWSGPVKVPAVCQYAHKQAYLLGETYKGGTHEDLKSTLFYL